MISGDVVWNAQTTSFTDVCGTAAASVTIDRWWSVGGRGVVSGRRGERSRETRVRLPCIVITDLGEWMSAHQCRLMMHDMSCIALWHHCLTYFFILFTIAANFLKWERGISFEAMTARCQRHREHDVVGFEEVGSLGRGCPLPVRLRDLGSIVSSQGGPGGAQAKNEFGAYFGW